MSWYKADHKFFKLGAAKCGDFCLPVLNEAFSIIAYVAGTYKPVGLDCIRDLIANYHAPLPVITCILSLMN